MAFFFLRLEPATCRISDQSLDVDVGDPYLHYMTEESFSSTDISCMALTKRKILKTFSASAEFFQKPGSIHVPVAYFVVKIAVWICSNAN